MKRFLLISVLPSLLGGGWAAESRTPESVWPSPVNQVFQWRQATNFSYLESTHDAQAIAYLWIPETCARLRGLIVMCANVPEHTLAGHPGLREVAARNDLGIVFSAYSFLCPNAYAKQVKDQPERTVAFLQRLLDGLAASSGYEEVATVPWIPIGESANLVMVDRVVNGAPQRVIAGVYLKNMGQGTTNRSVPVLSIVGTAYEWGQTATDLRTYWNSLDGTMKPLEERLLAAPGFPASLVIDGQSGHFDVAENLVAYVGRYVEAAVRARVAGPGLPLKAVDKTTGFVAGLPLPGREAFASRPWTERDAALAWYFTKEQADEAFRIADIDWKAQSQLPGFLDSSGTGSPREIAATGGRDQAIFTGNFAPLSFNGIAVVPLELEEDGVSFAVRPGLWPAIPTNAVGAGEPLAVTPGTPKVEWINGPVAPIGENRFQISLDRAPTGSCYLSVRQPAAPGVRGSVQPGAIRLPNYNSGAPQKITFDAIPDQKRTSTGVALRAFSDSGRVVRFYVQNGPAIVHGTNLVFTALPPRSALPVPVTVVAWEFGRSAPALKKATSLQTFQILP